MRLKSCKRRFISNKKCLEVKKKRKLVKKGI